VLAPIAVREETAPHAVLEVPDTDADLDQLLWELGARLGATPPITVGTPYGPVTFTVVPPRRPLPAQYLDDDLRDYVFTVCTSVMDRYGRQMRVGTAMAELEGDAVSAAWEDDATLEVRHLLQAAETAHAMRLNAATLVWSAEDDWDEEEHDQLRGELLLVTADGLDGDERRVALAAIDGGLTGTSGELLDAVRAILAPQTR